MSDEARAAAKNGERIFFAQFEVCVQKMSERKFNTTSRTPQMVDRSQLSANHVPELCLGKMLVQVLHTSIVSLSLSLFLLPLLLLSVFALLCLPYQVLN